MKSTFYIQSTGCAALIFTTVAFFLRQHFLGKRCKYNANLAGKTILVTGTNSGIGLALIEQLAAKGASLIITCRNHQKLCDTENIIRKKVPDAEIIGKILDLADFESVQKFSEDINNSEWEIFALVNNAGIFYAKPENTINNFDITFQTNYLGVFLLTISLLPALLKSREARIINLSSAAHLAWTDYPQAEFHQTYLDTPSNRFKAYQYSKFCVVLFSYKLSTVLSNTNVSVHCVDPGNVETNIYRHFPPLSNLFFFYLQKPIRIFLVKTAFEATQSVLFALLSPNPGFYIQNVHNTNQFNLNVLNSIFTDALWIKSRQNCGEYLTLMQ